MYWYRSTVNAIYYACASYMDADFFRAKYDDDDDVVYCSPNYFNTFEVGQRIQNIWYHTLLSNLNSVRYVESQKHVSANVHNKFS